jgi:cell division protein ZapA
VAKSLGAAGHNGAETQLTAFLSLHSSRSGKAHQRHNGVAPHTPTGEQWRRSAGSGAVKIEIYDQTYSIQADGNENYLNELAAYVDGKMRTVAEAARTVDSLKVAVLAALNIADEMFQLKQRQEKLEGPLRKRVEKCVALVEKALENTN